MAKFASHAHLISLDLNKEASIKITSSSELLQSPQAVTIAWQGVTASSSDIIALYAYDADPRTVAPFQLINADVASGGTHSKTGSGQAAFSVLNHRTNLSFMIIAFDPNSPKSSRVLAVSPPLYNLIPNLPSYGHLSIHESYSHYPPGDEQGRGVMVQWTSGSPKEQLVEYRLHSSDATIVEASKVTSYTRQDLCGPPANSYGYIHPGYIHTATMRMKDDWLSGSLVAYRYGSDEAGWSSEEKFRIPPRSSDSMSGDKPLVFLAFNDVAQALNPTLFDNPPCPIGCKTLPWLPWCPYYCGGAEFNSYFGANSKKLPPHLEAEDAHLALMIGDLSYAMGYASDWDAFGQQFENAFRTLPLAVGVGNHERDWPGTGDAFDIGFDSGGECGVPAERRFYTPGQGRLYTPGQGTLDNTTRSYYSFEAGPVHCLIVDSEISTDPQSPQGQFIARDLKLVDRGRTPWVVAGLHRMMWAPASDRRSPVGDLPVEERLQRDLEDMFSNAGVDLVIQGHQHAYARTCKLYKGECYDDEMAKGGIKAPVYVLAGNAGASFSHGQPKPLPHWCRSAAEDKNGYLRMTATRSELLMEAVSSEDGLVFDSVRLKAR